jgi:hypothetical protein
VLRAAVIARNCLFAYFFGKKKVRRDTTKPFTSPA